MKWNVFSADDDLLGFIETPSDTSEKDALLKAQETMPASHVEEHNEPSAKNDR